MGTPGFQHPSSSASFKSPVHHQRWVQSQPLKGPRRSRQRPALCPGGEKNVLQKVCTVSTSALCSESHYNSRHKSHGMMHVWALFCCAETGPKASCGASIATELLHSPSLSYLILRQSLSCQTLNLPSTSASRVAVIDRCAPWRSQGWVEETLELSRT